MNATVQKWGNSLALRLPAAMAKEIGIGEGDKVQLKIGSGGLVMTPSKPHYSLAALLEGITEENRHLETDWGSRKGNELW